MLHHRLFRSSRIVFPPRRVGNSSRCLPNNYPVAGSRSKFASTLTLSSEPPAQTFEHKVMAHQAYNSIVGSSGSTVVLTTVAVEALPEPPLLRTSNTFLTSEYRERHHAIGRIPKSRARRDFRMLSTGEVLASRAVDRSLRPILKEKIVSIPAFSRQGDEFIHRWHVQSSLQALNRTAMEGDGDPISLAINTAAVALGLDVAAVSLGVTVDGTVIQDAAPTRQEEWLGHLLFAGTAEGKCVMMEWGACQPRNLKVDEKLQIGLPDKMWPDLLDIACTGVRRRIDEIHDFYTKLSANSNVFVDEASLRLSLGLTNETDSSVKTNENDDAAIALETQQKEREEIIRECLTVCEERLELPLYRLFGWTGDEMPIRDLEAPPVLSQAFPMDQNKEAELLHKNARGLRESIMQAVVESIVKDVISSESKRQGEDEEEIDEACKSVAGEVYHKLMQKFLWKAATRYGCRSDGRVPRNQGFGIDSAGWNTIRPIKVTVPALPDTVHGSAHFSRGETGVLCTVTLASPKEGLPDQDPFDSLRRESQGVQSEQQTDSTDGFHSLPVGSIRFLRTQEALVSDLNSRNSQAEKERTGQSGSLAEVRRAFLQYDFPDYCTGQVPTGSGQRQNRRALGHGNLAEKALLPVLPTAEAFPYAVRITAETVDSNGSSSMASICGSLLALADAGVPILAPVAGISVGLALAEDGSQSEHGLLLDITGTEDYYGAMDFKVGGTRDAVTALQLDVKDPVKCSILLAGLELAQSGRNVVLDEMEAQLENGLHPRRTPKLTAPAVEVVKFDASRKRDLIGPGGVVLRQLEERYFVSIDLTQEGRCLLYGDDRQLVAKAKATVMDLVADVKEGEVYQGTIVELKDFGAIVELLRNKEGILHVSELTDEMEAKDHPEGIAGFVREHLSVGQTIDVLCTGVDPIQGSIKLSRKALLRRNQSQLLKK